MPGQQQKDRSAADPSARTDHVAVSQEPYTAQETHASRFSKALRVDGSTRLLFGVGAALLLLCLFLHATRLSHLTFTNHDDIRMDMIASQVRDAGFSAYWEHASHLARGQGRLYFYFSMLFFIAPYFTENEVLRAIGATTAHFASCGMLAVFLSIYLSPAIGLFVLAVIYLLLSHWSGHYPIDAYPFVYHTAFLMFFAAMCLYIAVLRGKAGAKRKRYVLAAAGVLLFFSYWVYEALWILFFVVSMIVAGIENRRSEGSGFRFSLGHFSLRGFIRVFGLPFLIFVSNTLIYIAYRVYYPGHYHGSKITWNTATNLEGIWGALQSFTIRSLPGVSFYELVRSVTDTGPVGYIVAHIQAAEVLQAALAGLFVACFLSAFWKSDPPTLRRTGAVAGFVGGLCLVMAFAVALPPTLTPKYQTDTLYSPYIPGYFAFLLYAVALVTAIVAAARALASRARYLRIAFQVFVSTVVVFATLATAVANDHAVRLMDLEGVKWRMMNHFLHSSAFTRVPDGSVIVAPSLWRGLDPQFGFYRDYWSLYVQGHTGRRIIFAKGFDRLAESKHVFYADVIPVISSREGVFMLSQLSEPTVGPYFTSDGITVICSYPPTMSGVSFLSQAGIAGQVTPVGEVISGERRITGALPFVLDGSAYVADVQASRVIIGTANLVSVANADDLGPSSLEIVFGNGFSVLERGAGKYWRWNDGADGVATLEFKNHLPSTVAAQFKAIIRTGAQTKTRMDITIQGNPVDERSVSNGDTIAFGVLLPPGGTSVQLRSYGPRIGSGWDSRYVIFGLENWTVTSLPEVSAYEGGSPVSVSFTSGFWHTERNATGYWRWSTDPGGVGQMTLSNRSPHHIDAMIFFELFNLQDAKYDHEIQVGGVKTVLEVNYKHVPFIRTISIPPGDTNVVIRSAAPHAPLKSGEARSFVFGIANWKVFLYPSSDPTVTPAAGVISRAAVR